MQDLLKIYEGLISQKKQAKKLVERIAKLQRLGPAETKAVLDLCSWKDDQFCQLLTVIEKYECYETEDVKEKVKSTVHISQVKMSKGEVLTMPNRLLVKLSKVNAEYFMKVADTIKEGKVSLRGAIEMYEKDKARHPVKLQIEEVSGQKFETVESKYPKHFSTAVIDTFIGATAFNVKGKELKSYVTEVITGGQAIQKQVKVEEMKQYDKIVKESDVLVIRCGQSERVERIEEWLDKVCNKDLITVLLFDSEKDQLQALMYLRATKGDDLQTQQLFFEKNPKEVKQNEEVNLQFCLVSGQPESLKGKVKIYSGKFDNLRLVVNKFSRPGCKVSCISDTNHELLLVHSESLAASVTYFGTQEQINEVKRKITREGGIVSDNTEAERKVNDSLLEEMDTKKSEKKGKESEYNNNASEISQNNTDNISQFETEQFRKTCNECGDSFDNQTVMDEHCIKMHSDYKCIQCGKEFTTKESINEHKKQMHDGRFQGLIAENGHNSPSLLDSLPDMPGGSDPKESGSSATDESENQEICSDSD